MIECDSGRVWSGAWYQVREGALKFWEVYIYVNDRLGVPSLEVFKPGLYGTLGKVV